MNRSYKEMSHIDSFEDRYEYLKLQGVIGESTFGWDRYINQLLYTSRRWRKLRDDIIIRDNGLDLSHEDHVIFGKIIIHHINPITLADIENEANCVYDPNNLVSTSLDTHNAIHYGRKLRITQEIVRSKNDTSPWKLERRTI